MEPFTNSTHSPMQSLRVSVPLWLAIDQHLREWLPYEGCGLLGGRFCADGSALADRFFPGSNVLRSATRFRMADGELIDAFRLMREAGLDLIGIVHSHPRTEPRPSETDLAELHYPQAAMLIVGYASGAGDPTAWIRDQSAESGVRRVPLSIEPANTGVCVSL